MSNDSTAVDFGINLLEEEIDDVIFRTNEFLTDATFTGGQDPPDVDGLGRTLRHHRLCAYGLQDDGQA